MTILDIPSDVQVSLVEIQALKLATNIVEILYYSTISYITSPTDTPANTAYQSRLVSALDISNSLKVQGHSGAVSAVGQGTIELSNIDGVIDVLETEYALVGRDVVVLTGDLTGGHSSLSTVFSGTIQSLDFSDSSLLLQVQDTTSVIAGEISKSVYVSPGGTGEETFNNSLHGSPVPICFGDALNVSPKYVGKLLVGDPYTARFDPYYIGDMVLSGSDLVVTNDNHGVAECAYADVGISTGKYYSEIIVDNTTPTGDWSLVGISTSSSRPRSDSYVGLTSNSWGYFTSDGKLYNSGVGATFGSSYVGAVTTIGIAIDADAGKVWFSKNNVWQNSGDPAAGTNAAISGLTDDIFIGVSSNNTAITHTGVFATGSLTYAAPTGFNAGTAVPVSVSELVYQVHDGAITDITAVYANGSELATNQYTKYLSEGKFQIGIGSVSGATITADVQGDSTPTVYNNTADIIQHILADRISPAVTIDAAKFTALETAYFEGVSIVQNATAGVYLDKGGPIENVLSEFNRSFGLFSGFNRAGVFDIGVFLAPDSGASVVSLTEEYILDVELLQSKQPYHSYVLGYRHNNTLMQEANIAATVVENEPDLYSFITNKYKQEEADVSELGIRKADSVVEAIPPGSEALYWDIVHRFPLATAAPFEGTVIQSSAEALLEARRRWRLYNSDTELRQRSILSVQVKIRLGEIQVNDTVHITYPRFGLDAGKYFRVVGYTEDLATNRTTLEIWG